MGRLRVRDAKRRQDEHALLSFRCSRGDESEHWIQEVEEYVRRFALRTARHVLLFESDDGNLAAVSAFDLQEVSLSGRRRSSAWRLEVIALNPAWWGKAVEADIEGCPTSMKASEYVLRSTFRRMLEIDPRRVVVVARVHDENRASMATCARVGLDRTERESDDYWAMLGEVDPAAGPTAAS